MSPVPCGLSPVDTILVLKFEWGQRGQAVLRFEWKSGWDQTGKLELASTLTFGFVNPAGTEPNEYKSVTDWLVQALEYATSPCQGNDPKRKPYGP